MVKIAVVGLGKMGLSHLSMARATPNVEIAAVCDSSNYLLGVLSKYTGVRTYSSYPKMLTEARPDAAIIATPSSLHARMVRAAVERGIHVFCEKPFCLDPDEGMRLSELARDNKIVTQVGYHNRFVGAFRQVKSLLDQRAIGEITHIVGEAYGPVVLKAQGSTWRSNSSEGGGALYDYAAHPLNLINWYLGAPIGVGGSVLKSIHSCGIDDAVMSTLDFGGGRTAQLSVNWSDDSVRKMTTRITIWGTEGRIFADRQECHAYLRSNDPPFGFQQGWNVRYTTEMTDPVAFYLRGEEYSAQLEEFVRRVEAEKVEGENDFESAVVTDRSISMIRSDARRGALTPYTGSMGSRGPAASGWRTRLMQWRADASSSLRAEHVRAAAERMRQRVTQRRDR